MSELRAAHDSIPHLCHIEMTYQCNQNCIFCYNPKRSEVTDEKQVDKIVTRVAEAEIPHVYLIGGEPSLLGSEKLNEYIDMLHETSSVTIVTNGYKKLENLSDNLACIAVPLHGSTKEEHEYVNQKKGSFEAATESIKHYVSTGIDVRCVIVLTGYNYDKMYDIISLAASLGMESVFVDRYEDGGIGACNSSHYKLKPSLDEFRIALDQIIKARNDYPIFEGKVAFGTAIPYCVDERMMSEKMASSCGAGTTFCAINSAGDVRLCNQSELVYGNILEENIDVIWNKKSLDDYRDLEWVEEPCKSCKLLTDCQSGCRVDSNCSEGFCIDYAIRERDAVIDSNIERIQNGDIDINKLAERDLPSHNNDYYRVFAKNKFAKINTKYDENFLVSRYDTTKLGNSEIPFVEYVFNAGVTNERELSQKFSEFEEESIRVLVDYLEYLNAIDVKGLIPKGEI